MVIYLIENKLNNKKYIGKTTRSLNTRWNNHKKSKSCPILASAIKEYGIDNFSIKQIYKAKDKKELALKEKELIEKYNTLHPNGYNILRCDRSLMSYREVSNLSINKRINSKGAYIEKYDFFARYVQYTYTSSKKFKKYYYYNVHFVIPFNDKTKRIKVKFKDPLPAIICADLLTLKHREGKIVCKYNIPSIVEKLKEVGYNWLYEADNKDIKQYSLEIAKLFEDVDVKEFLKRESNGS